MTDSEKAREAARIKALIDDYRADWDRLDKQGSSSSIIQKQQIAQSIERLVKRLRDLTGENYLAPRSTAVKP